MQPEVINSNLKNLVSALPEVYQPIYSHPELSSIVSRDCQDRLKPITQLHNSLVAKLNRPLRILDLGSAQGFFSFNLATLGATVHGVDFLGDNVAVCQNLAEEHDHLNITFQIGRIENVLNALEENQYDLVLGLSVFHHIVHEKGAETVAQILGELAKKITVGIFEFALDSEPLYWAETQPEHPISLIEKFSFIHETATHSTHLSEISRPMYVASNHYWYFNEEFTAFNHWKPESHSLTFGAHQSTRRYFLNNDLFVKIYYLSNKKMRTINLLEYQNEVEYLSLEGDTNLTKPKLLSHGISESEAWLIRTKIQGELLSNYIQENKPYDAESTVLSVLEQLVALEKKGKYHNDVRIWNVLIDQSGKAHLIDYGAISDTPSDCMPPHNLLLSFIIFVREVFDRSAESSIPVRTPHLSPKHLPEPYRSATLAFLCLSPSEWSYSCLYNFYTTKNITNKNFPAISPEGYLLTLNTVEEAMDLYCANEKQASTHAEHLEEKVNQLKGKVKQLEGHAKQLEDNAKPLVSKVEQAETDAQRAEAKAVQLHTELHSAYTSHSWKITAPLRWISRQSKLLLQQGLIGRIKALLKKTTTTIFQKSNAYIHARPILRNRVVNILKRLRVYTPLRSVYLRLTGRQHETKHLSVEQLTVSAKQIYERLETSINDNVRSNS